MLIPADLRTNWSNAPTHPQTSAATAFWSLAVVLIPPVPATVSAPVAVPVTEAKDHA
jgi:hypothetical protein